MSTAAVVPETWELTGDDARATLHETGRVQLVRDAFVRLRSADGFSHARSMAFVVALVMVQGLIAVVGLATALGRGTVSTVIVRSLRAAVPGPAGHLLTRAVLQAQHAGAGHRYLALTLGTIGTLVTGTTLMGQIERALNRLYGIEQDRPTVQKYGRAFVLAVTAGALTVLAFAVLTFGREIGQSLADSTVADVWSVLRWPLGLALLAAGLGLLFRWSPNRHQPAWSWLEVGAAVAVALWTLSTVGLALTFRLGTTFGQTYGPLAGIVALLLWSFLTSVSLLYGAAVAAQLEAVRAARPQPKDERKAEPPVGAPVEAVAS